MKAKEGINSDLLLFVSGISSKATSQEMMLLFADFGKFRLLRLRSNKRGAHLKEADPQNNIRRGFCILEAADQNGFDAILANSGCLHKGRQLTISRLRDEKEFSEYTDLLSKKCVTLADVPKVISPNRLADFIAERFGVVKKIVHLKKSKSLENGTSPFFKSFLVEFGHATNAETAIKQRQLEYPYKDKWFRISIQPFERRISRKGPANRKESPSTASFSNNSPLLKTVEMLQEDHYSGITLWKTKAQEKTTFMDENHFSKPTSKSYLAPRLLHFEGLIPGGCPQRPVNLLRFNLMPRRTLH